MITNDEDTCSYNSFGAKPQEEAIQRSARFNRLTGEEVKPICCVGLTG